MLDVPEASWRVMVKVYGLLEEGLSRLVSVKTVVDEVMALLVW